jgi:DNA invertase Pin-like site-specific DNA recombinase
MTLIGYAHTYPDEDQLRDHLARLRAAGCQRVYADAGSPVFQPVLDALLGDLGPHDVLVVVTLNDLAMQLWQLVRLLARVDNAGAGVRVLKPELELHIGDAGVWNFVSALEEFERTVAARGEKLRARPKIGPRAGRAGVLSPAQLTQARKMRNDGASWQEIANVMRCAKSTVHRALHMPSYGKTEGGGP